MPGVFIALEGGDGSGKSTIAAWLADAIRQTTGRDLVLTREPGGTAIGERIRELLLGGQASGMLPETEALLFAAARAQHVGEVIRPALERGAIVISDRFTDSSIAYQCGGRGLPITFVSTAQELATGGLEPDVKLLLDVSPEEATARRSGRATTDNHLDQEQQAFHDRVRAAYHALAAADPGRWRVIDAAQCLASVQRDVRDALSAFDLFARPREESPPADPASGEA